MANKEELRADKFSYMLAQDNRILLGGGSSTKAQVRIYPTYAKAESMRNKHFPKAEIMRVILERIEKF